MAQGSSNPTTDLKKVAGTAVDVNTGNASAGTQRVVLASNQPVIPVSDNSGSLTVDAPVGTPVFVRLSDGSAAISTLPVSLASVPSHPVTNAGTFAVQATQVVGSAATRWYTQISDGTNSPSIKAASTAAAAADPALVVAISPNNTVGLSAGTNAIGKLAANSGVDIGDVDVTSIIPGTGATNLGKQTDSAAGATDTGVAILGIRDDALTTLTPVDGDYTRFRVNSVGRLWTSATIDAALPAGTNSIGTVEIGATSLAALETISAAQSGTWTVGLSAGSNAIGKLAANDAVDIGDVTINNAIGSGVYVRLTDGTNVMPTGDAAARGVYHRVTDGTNTAAVKAASTAAVATDPALVVAISPNNTVPVSLASVPTHAVTQSGTWTVGLSAGSNAIGSITNTTFASTQSGTWTVQPGNTANTTPWLIKTPISAGQATLSSLNAAITQPLEGNTSAGLVLSAPSSPVGFVLTPYYSLDGTNFVATVFDDPSTNNKVATLTNADMTAGRTVGIILGSGATHVRVVATSWTSGSITARIAASMTYDPTLLYTGAPNSTARPTTLAQVGGWDGTTTRTLSTNASGHLNIADGGNSITVDGTVAATQSGTWTVQPGNTANTTPWLVKPAESLGTATALGALNAEIVQALNGNMGSAMTITATATPTGITLTPYTSYDGGTNWTVTQFFNSANGDAINTITSFTVGASYSISAGDGATHVKVVATAWTSGSVTVRLSSSNSQGLVNLKATSVHDDPAGSFMLQMGAVGSATAPTAVSANGDAVRLWATTSGALNIADGGTTISVDDGAGSLTVDGTVTANQGTAAAVANSWYTKLSDGTNGPVAVKAAGIRPTTSDPSLVVQIAPQNEVRIRPSETMRDPVDKLRVSTPQSLIDTDFEYGIQPTKWESVTLLNNRATAFIDVTTPMTGITGITASSKTVTIAGSGFTLTAGQPIFITGTLDQANVDGWWIVDTASATNITFLVNNAPAATLYDSTKTYVYGGTFFTGSNIPLDAAQTLSTVVIAGTAGQFTCAAATLAVGDMIRISGTLGGTGTITGYTDPSIYYIIATNGSTSFTLSATPGGAAITTTAGTPTGLTYVNTSVAVSGTTVIVRTSGAHGLRPGNKIYMTGTTGVTGGPVNGTWSVATTPTNNIFTYTTNATATGAITYAAASTLHPAQPGFVDHRPYDGGVQFSNETAYHGYQDIRQTRRYFRYQSGKGIQFSTGTILKPPFYVDQLTSSGTTVTVTTKYPHGLLNGSTIIVSGASPAAYNGTFTVTGTTALTITYTAGSAPGTSPATGFPITVSPGTWYGGSNRIGMFDNQNGFFYEHDGQTMYAVLRKSVDQISGRVAVTAGSQLVTGTGTFFAGQLKPGDNIVIRGMTYRVEIITSDTQMYISPEYRGVTTSNTIVTKTVETRIPQTSWNIDRCNGAGGTVNPSGFNLDLTRMQMFYMDYSWYGAGAVRFGFKDQNGEIIIAHRITNSNVNYEAYMRSGNLPARYETNTLAPKTYLTATLANTTTTGGTITVADTSLFPATGTIAIYQPQQQGGAIEFITYTAKTATTFTIGARTQSLGVQTAQTFTYSATAPIYVEAYVPQAAQTLSHWGSSVIMDGRYDDDKSLVFNTGMTTAMITATAGTRYPLISLRLAPTVDNGQTGLLGAREIINRMQLTLRSIGTYTQNTAFRIELILNGRVSGGTFTPVGGSSLSQYCLHTNTQTVSGGEALYAFYTGSGSADSESLEQVRDLGNSVMGGGTSNSYPTTNLNKYPDGPDVVTVVAIPLTTNAASSIVARLNWSEAQA